MTFSDAVFFFSFFFLEEDGVFVCFYCFGWCFMG